MFVLVVELVEHRSEKLADRVSRAHEEQIGQIKDMGSAAVGLIAAHCRIDWLVALAERFAWTLARRSLRCAGPGALDVTP